MAAAVVLVGGAVAVGALATNGSPSATESPAGPPMTQTERFPTTLTDARQTGLATSSASVELRPLRATSFGVGLVNPATQVDPTVVDAAGVDLVVGWAEGDLADQLGTGWASYRGIAWRTDTWRSVETRRLTLGDRRITLVRLANLHSTRWLWVAALPRHVAVRPLQRQLADQLRSQPTPWLIVATSRDRFSGERIDVQQVDHQGPGLRVGRVMVPAT